MTRIDRVSAGLDARLVRYADLIPCTTAFIDARTPGSERKENFTIIGPGVAENPDQHVHISEAHGFNIGGARQPPGCVNSQHSHETEEVFVVHSGTWAFRSGENGEDGEVTIRRGDVISIPTHAFRGFENVGDDLGFLFAVLGGDDPGRVTWAPYVFDSARAHGLVLLESGRLIDTAAGERLPDDAAPMPETGPEDVARMEVLNDEAMRGCVARFDDFCADDSTRIISRSPTSEPGLLGWAHGFELRYLACRPSATAWSASADTPTVLMMLGGAADVLVGGDPLRLAEGDVFTIPPGAPYEIAGAADTGGDCYLVCG
ncbi:MAG: cupin domain-containing protein [Pseudomonadota bacterium]